MLKGMVWHSCHVTELPQTCCRDGCQRRET